MTVSLSIRSARAIARPVRVSLFFSRSHCNEGKMFTSAYVASVSHYRRGTYLPDDLATKRRYSRLSSLARDCIPRPSFYQRATHSVCARSPARMQTRCTFFHPHVANERADCESSRRASFYLDRGFKRRLKTSPLGRLRINNAVAKARAYLID